MSNGHVEIDAWFYIAGRTGSKLASSILLPLTSTNREGSISLTLKEVVLEWCTSEHNP